MTTVLQKAVLPGREHAWLTLGDDLLTGFVVNAADVTWATTPRDLYGAMGLGFPGSPLSPELPFIDVLRFPMTPLMQLVPAVARTEQYPWGFVDRPPVNGSGFFAVEHHPPVPFWWLEPTRVPPTAELWRIHQDGRSEVVAVYDHLASGWRPGTQPPRIAPSDVFGTFADWQGRRVLADTLPNDEVVIGSAEPHPDLKLVERGLWAANVESSDLDPLYELKMTATWRGLRFQLVRRLTSEAGISVRAVYIGHDADAAEAARLEKTDAGVYEATIPAGELTDVEAVQLQQPAR